MLTPYNLGDDDGGLDSVHNYYEHIVFEEIARQLQDASADSDFTADVACVALNHLPPHYIRHHVDMAFYLSPKASQEIEEKVANAVRNAIVFVTQRGGRNG